MGCELAASVIERHGRRLHGRARTITIDLDPTDDPTHGAQQLTFFNGHYDSWCYLPLLAFLTFNDESEQYLCAAMSTSSAVLTELFHLVGDNRRDVGVHPLGCGDGPPNLGSGPAR